MNTSQLEYEQRRWYFVVRLAPENPQYNVRRTIEIQMLDPAGRARYVGYAGDHETELQIEGYSIPQAVLEAARRQPPGQGDYVNDSGQSISPF
jgi:hypothetical protein